jgi:hypothetical protein
MEENRMKKCLALIALLGVTACSQAVILMTEHPPPGSAEAHDPTVLTALLAGAGNDQTVVIPPGIYRLCDTVSAGITVKGLQRTSIAADGVTLVLRTGQTFDLNDCEDVTLSGLTVDYDPLPFTQGIIREINMDDKTVTIELETGFPEPESLPSAGQMLFFVYDPSGEPRSVLHDGFHEITRVSDQTYRLGKEDLGFLFDSVGQPDGARVGDSITLCRREAYALGVKNGCRITLDRVTVFTSPGYAFWESGGEGGNRYLQCRIIRKPATTRLLTTVADGLHSYQVRKGPLIEECEFNDTVDDTIAIHGFFSMVLEVPSTRTLYLVSPFGQDFSAGAELSFYEMPHGRPLGEAVATLVEKVPETDLSVPVEEVRQSFIRQGLSLRDFPVKQALKVKLDRDLCLPQGKLILVSSGERCGSGAVIRNNTLRRGHVRGVIVKADNVLIESNRFERIGVNAVLIQPELFFMEGPAPQGVTIRGNTAVRCGGEVLNSGYALPGIGGTIQTGSVMGRSSFPPQLDPYPLIRDVCVADNMIKESGGFGIVLGNVDSGQVSGNRIEQPFSAPGAGESAGLAAAFGSQTHDGEKPSDPRAVPCGILIYGSQNISLSENVVAPPAEKGGVPPWIIGPWCRNIEQKAKRSK